MALLQLHLTEQALPRKRWPVLHHGSIQIGVLPPGATRVCFSSKGCSVSVWKTTLRFSIRWSIQEPQTQGEWLVCPVNSAGRELTKRETMEFYSWENLLCCAELPYLFLWKQSIFVLPNCPKGFCICQKNHGNQLHGGCARQTLFPAVSSACFSLSQGDTP